MRSFNVSNYKWFDDPLDIINEKNIDTVIELIGGEDGLAYDLAINSLKNDKSFITANKALISKHGEELSILTEKHKIFFGFEASVAGGIPIIKTLKESLILNEIREKNRKLNPIIKTDTNIKSTKTNKPTRQTKNGKTEYYTIQLSSFENKKAAEKLAKKMTGLGYPSRVTEAWVKGKTWYRVQHGEYKMVAVAKQVSIKLKNKYKFNPWISNIYK